MLAGITVHILVLNYNGKDLLEQFFPSVIKAAKNSKYPCQASIVDNQSNDGSVEFVRKYFPSTGLFIAPKNEVICSYNEVLKKIDSEVVILLNNDIEAAEDFVDYLIGHFQDEDVFFVAPRLLNFDQSYNGGRSNLYFDFGIIKNIVDTDNAAIPGKTSSIGTGAFRKNYFLRLGGYDRLYLPGIWEEVDMCYRAQSMGKKGIYEPRSIIWHKESTTFNREYGNKKKLIIAHRNMFLFFWKNIRDIDLILRHIFFIPFRIIYSLVSGKTEFAIGFILALPRLQAAVLARLRENRKGQRRIIKDKDIIRCA